MNIPHKYLINNGLSESKKKFYEKLTSCYKRAYAEYRKKNSNDFNKKVTNWLFSQNEETRMILCSVENKKYTNTIHEAFTYYEQNSKDVKFIITDEDVWDGEKFKLETHYDNNKNKFEKTENTFLDNIVFYQCESPADDINNYSNYFTLNPKYLKNVQIFRSDCSEISNSNFLSSPIMTKKEVQSKENILSFELPNWISNDNNENININNNNNNTEDNNCKKQQYFSLAQYMLALIEQVLSVRYLLFYDTKNLKEILTSTYLYDLFNKKKLILSYLNNISIKPQNLYTYFTIEDITTKIFYNENIEKFIKEKKNYVKEYDYTKVNDNPEYYHTHSYETEQMLEEILKKYKYDKNEFYKNLLDICMFFKINRLYTLDDFILRLIFEKIYEEYMKKLCDDLITDEEKKQPKKRKKNNFTKKN